MLVQDAGDLKDKCFLQSTEVALTMTTTVSVVQQVNTEHEKNIACFWWTSLTTKKNIALTQYMAVEIISTFVVRYLSNKQLDQ